MATDNGSFPHVRYFRLCILVSGGLLLLKGFAGWDRPPQLTFRVSNMDIRDLTVLIDQAVGATSVVYTWGQSPPPQPMEVSEYRSLLQSFRDGYNPTAREQAQHFKPVVGDDAIGNQLLAVIRDYLGDRIRDERLKSASHATLGGLHEGFTVDDLL